MTELLRELESVVGLAEKASNDEPWQVDQEGDVVCNGEDVAWAITNKLDAPYIAALNNLFRTHHAEIAEAVKLAKWYRGLRDSDPDNGEPYIARERQDSWGNWKTEWLGGLDADRALDAMHNSAREAGE